MIVIEEHGDRLMAHVYGEMTLDDFREFEDAVTNELSDYDHVDILFDLSNMTGFSLDVALEEMRFAKAHARDYRRIAVITDSQWLAWVSWLAGAFVDTDVQHFPDLDSAQTWLAME